MEERRDGMNLYKSRIHHILDSVDRDTRLYIKLETRQAIPSDSPLLYSWQRLPFVRQAALAQTPGVARLFPALHRVGEGKVLVNAAEAYANC